MREKSAQSIEKRSVAKYNSASCGWRSHPRSCDGIESVEGLLITPQQALRDAEAGSRTVVFPIKMNLLKLARFRTVAEAGATTCSAPVMTAMPRIEQTADSHTPHIPETAGQ